MYLVNIHDGVLENAVQPYRVLAARVWRDRHRLLHTLPLVQRQVLHAAQQPGPVGVGNRAALIAVLLQSIFGVVDETCQWCLTSS